MKLTFWGNNKKSGMSSQKSGDSMFKLIDDLPYDIADRVAQISIGNNASAPNLNNDALLAMYKNVGDVNSIINYIAASITRGEIKHYRYESNGKKKDLGETDEIKLIDSMPIYDIICQFLIFGNCPIQLKKYAGFEDRIPDAVLLPANRVYKIMQHSTDRIGTPITSILPQENPVISFRAALQNGSYKDYKKEEIVYISANNPDKVGVQYYYGQSPLFAAIRNIDVLSNIYDTINTILGAKGALGFLSYATKPMDGDPMAYREDVEKFEKKMMSYGTVRGKIRSIFATFIPLRWNRMDSPINEFMPIELTAQQFDKLCNQFYGFPSVLLNSKTASTYNNIRELRKSYVNYTLMPICNTISEQFSAQLGLSTRNEWIEIDFSNDEATQEDLKTKFEGLSVKFDYLMKLVDAGIMPISAAAQELGISIEQFNTAQNEREQQRARDAQRATEESNGG